MTFKLFDNKGNVTGKFYADNFKQALDIAYIGFKGKITKSLISEILLSEEECNSLSEWFEELVLAQEAREEV